MSERTEGHDASRGQEAVPSVRTAPTAQTHATPRPREPASPYLRAENEDDDGYDPFSDRPARHEPLFERDPWK